MADEKQRGDRRQKKGNSDEKEEERVEHVFKRFDVD